jgi:hypothetical protein
VIFQVPFRIGSWQVPGAAPLRRTHHEKVLQNAAIVSRGTIAARNHQMHCLLCRLFSLGVILSPPRRTKDLWLPTLNNFILSQLHYTEPSPAAAGWPDALRMTTRGPNVRELFHVEQFELFPATFVIEQIVSRETIAPSVASAFSPRRYLSHTLVPQQRGSHAQSGAYF